MLYELENLVFAEILIKKPDGNECDNPMIRNGNELWYTLRSQDINVAGECRCNIMLTFSDCSILTTPEFSIMVYNQVINQEGLKSQNEYEMASQYVLYAKECQEQADQSAQLAKEYMQEALKVYEVLEAAQAVIDEAKQYLTWLQGIEIPTKVSDLENDNNYVTVRVTDEINTNLKGIIERLEILEEKQGYPGISE